MTNGKRARGVGGTARRSAAAVAPATRSATLAKARERAKPASARPSLARTELLDKATRARFEQELDAAVKRRPTYEARLAGAVRAVASLSPALRASLGEATAVLLRRGARQRELYGCGLRALAEAQDRQAASLLRQALAGEDAGGASALSAAALSTEPELAAILAKVAGSRQSHLAFGAELARVARRESSGALLGQLAPMIKESHRISMCVELFVPLLRCAPLSPSVGPALAVLRGAERHLGRWLLLAELAVRAGDLAPLEDARARASAGPESSRAAWSLVTWALEQTDAASRGRPAPAAPDTRPTLELVARLSDRPSADRDTTFLFRLGEAAATSARSMLEALSRARPVVDESGVRAALYLARDHGRSEHRDALAEAASPGRREEIRGLAAAALWDASPPGAGDHAVQMRARAVELSEELLESRVLGNVAWGALLRAAARGAGREPLVSETRFRWIQWGAFE